MARSRPSRFDGALAERQRADLGHEEYPSRRFEPTQGPSRARRAAAEMADAMLRASGAGTAEHSVDVEHLALRVADEMGLTGEHREQVGVTARLHDIGKVSIPALILEKPGELSPGEWAVMLDHTVVGERILASVEELGPVATYVRHSHERWDGAGYPDGLAGEGIPLTSRIVFCADAFQAICADRPYRHGRAPIEALAEVRRCAGTQFDPTVVDALTRAVRPWLYQRPKRLRRRSHARLPLAIMIFVIGAMGSVAAAVTRESVPAIPPPTSAAYVAKAPAPAPAPSPFESHIALGAGSVAAAAGGGTAAPGGAPTRASGITGATTKLQPALPAPVQGVAPRAGVPGQPDATPAPPGNTGDSSTPSGPSDPSSSEPTGPTAPSPETPPTIGWPSTSSSSSSEPDGSWGTHGTWGSGDSHSRWHH